ncbi:hypothetical protein CDAR_248601 [Caerostris darwini]|uniref:Uncharacterized protein n=1 Tax=Caerostris darwini TaxID=1538125 RepID=A0AAV4RJZ4_9ARAC|nr:hypothetical protein CDAR_248601 [Caerostris darwini]
MFKKHFPIAVSPNLNLMTKSHQAKPWRTPASNYFPIGSRQRDDPDKCGRQSNIRRPGMESASNSDECSSQINVRLGRTEKALAAAAFEVVPAFVAKLIGPHLPLLERVCVLGGCNCPCAP